MTRPRLEFYWYPPAQR